MEIKTTWKILGLLIAIGLIYNLFKPTEKTTQIVYEEPVTKSETVEKNEISEEDLNFTDDEFRKSFIEGCSPDGLKKEFCDCCADELLKLNRYDLIEILTDIEKDIVNDSYQKVFFKCIESY
jgi:hypothetical protein